MCGIAGIITKIDPSSGEAAIQGMVGASKHRGPDGCGSVKIRLEQGHLFLGHTRLSIIDLSELGNQPMGDPATNSWVVYNGEIYNFREVRKELEHLGVTFRSQSDTEVLLQALIKWGEEALAKLKGMYAFGFWDGLKRELVLARDPFGIKPLYYSERPGVFIFGSEVKVIQASRLGDFTLDRNAVGSFLTYGAVIEPLTIINEIKELPPGSLLRVRQKGEIKQIKSFWPFLWNELKVGDNTAFSDAVNSVKTEIARSVQSHLISDVPVGIFLSGGVDSSLISLLASRGGQEIKLLTVGFPEEEFSEVKHARIVAEKAQRDHEVIFITSDRIQNLLPQALSSMDQPTVDGINTYVISNVASSLGIKVLLSGLGGDELFGGYTTYRNVPFLLRFRSILPAVARLMLKTGAPDPAKWHKVSQIGGLKTLKEIYLLHRSIRWNGVPGAFESERIPPEEFSVSEGRWDTLLKGDDTDDFRKIASCELFFYMANQLLRDADVFSMANSVELRVPFLDLEVAKVASGVPQRYHQGLWRGKKVTREILKGLCPELPSNRRKMGFTFPWKSWLRMNLKDTVSETLHKGSLYKTMGLDPEKGKRLFADFQKGHPMVSWYQIWSLFVLLKWQERNRISS
jgi:asparagine synthase (glutamine-hydrolysing)